MVNRLASAITEFIRDNHLFWEPAPSTGHTDSEPSETSEYQFIRFDSASKIFRTGSSELPKHSGGPGCNGESDD